MKRITRLRNLRNHIHDQVKKLNIGSQEIDNCILTMIKIQKRINKLKSEL